MASMMLQKSVASLGCAKASTRRSVVSRAVSERPKETLAVPGTTDKYTLGYLDGKRPGDYGFDPLGLMDPKDAGGLMTPEYLSYSEVFHCRLAMLGVTGCIAPEFLAWHHLAPEATGLPWFASGVFPRAGDNYQYWTDNFSLFWIEVLAISFAEHKRLQDFRYPGSQGKQYFLGLEGAFNGSGDPAYPGGPWFNMFNFGKSPEEMHSYKAKEIKNGRLAMLGMWGYGAQAVMTGKGPFQNLVEHLADPTGANVATNWAKVLAQ